MPQPGSNEIHVWDIDLDGAAADAAVLSPDERERAARFRFDEHRARFIRGRAALRRILARYTGAGPAGIAFEYNRFGKPELAGAPGLRFNTSHSAGRQMVAVARREVGIDVERVRSGFRFEDIVKRFLPPEDAAAASSAEAFFRVWTRREAFLKATGRGLTGLRTPITPPWTVTDLDAGEGWAAAVAVEGGGCRIIRRVFFE